MNEELEVESRPNTDSATVFALLTRVGARVQMEWIPNIFQEVIPVALLLLLEVVVLVGSAE